MLPEAGPPNKVGMARCAVRCPRFPVPGGQAFQDSAGQISRKRQRGHRSAMSLPNQGRRRGDETHFNPVSTPCPARLASGRFLIKAGISTTMDASSMTMDGPPRVIDGPPIGIYAPPRVIDGPPIGIYAPPMVMDAPPIGIFAPPMVMDGPPIGIYAPPMVMDGSSMVMDMTGFGMTVTVLTIF